MIYGYARVSTDGQSMAAQVAVLQDAGAEKVWREIASGAKTDRVQLCKALAALEPGDVMLVVRLDRLARSTRDLLNTLAAIAGRGAALHSLADAWADTTAPHGRLMVTLLASLAEFERELIRTRTTECPSCAQGRGVKMGRKPKLTLISSARQCSANRAAAWFAGPVERSGRSAAVWAPRQGTRHTGSCRN